MREERYQAVHTHFAYNCAMVTAIMNACCVRPPLQDAHVHVQPFPAQHLEFRCLQLQLHQGPGACTCNR